jgi:hypothetical protein
MDPCKINKQRIPPMSASQSQRMAHIYNHTSESDIEVKSNTKTVYLPPQKSVTLHMGDNDAYTIRLDGSDSIIGPVQWDECRVVERNGGRAVAIYNNADRRSNATGQSQPWTSTQRWLGWSALALFLLVVVVTITLGVRWSGRASPVAHRTIDRDIVWST